MAGIGFELKKLFQHTGVFASLRAFGYATVITTGPMLLGVVLLLGLMWICTFAGISKSNRELLVCMITYVLLASVTVTSFLSMIVTRFTADMLFEDRNEEVLPSFWGSALLMMVVGGILWLIFLIFSGATFVQGVLLYILFQELILVWHAMSYLTAIKDYRNLFRSFFVAIGLSLLLGLLLVVLFHCPAIESLLFSVSVGYGVKAIWDIVLLYRHFPRSKASAFSFMEWMDKFPELPWIGFFTNMGLFSHLVIMWFSEVGVQVKGLFYGAPYWGNALFQRALKTETFRQALDAAVEDLKAYLSPERINAMAEEYSAIIKPYLYRMPDVQYAPLTETEYDAIVSGLNAEIQANYDSYYESYLKPMPFYIDTPRVQDGKMVYTWNSAYDFNSETITYTFELATDYTFSNPLIKQEGLLIPDVKGDTLPAGQYFIRVTAENTSGYQQYAFDYYVIDSGKVYGTKCFYVLEDGSIVEDVYVEG